LIAERDQLVRCAKGMRVMPDRTFADVPELDVLLVPGGQGTRREVNNPVLSEFLRTKGASAAWLTSVCTGALLPGGPEEPRRAPMRRGAWRRASRGRGSSSVCARQEAQRLLAAFGMPPRQDDNTAPRLLALAWHRPEDALVSKRAQHAPFSEAAARSFPDRLLAFLHREPTRAPEAPRRGPAGPPPRADRPRYERPAYAQRTRRCFCR
jgi:DJ-1/PfpI family